MNLSVNLICVSLNYQRLDERAINNLNQADLPTSKEFLQTLKAKIGFEIDSITIIKKCNALMILVSFSDTLSQDFVRGRILHSWDELSHNGIADIKRDIKFYENVEALKFLAECAIGIHSVTTGDSQVLSQISEGLRNRISVSIGKSTFDFVDDWLKSLADECRHKTEIFKGNTSLERIASELAIQKYSKESATILIGYGKSGKLIAKILNEENDLPVHIINRSPISLNINSLSSKISYSQLNSDFVPENVGTVLIAVTNTPETNEMISKILNKIKDNNVTFIDLSTPPILNGKVSNFTDISMLSNISAKTICDRKDAVNKARKLIEQHVKSIVDRINSYYGTMFVTAQKNVVIPVKDLEREVLINKRGEMFKYIRKYLDTENFIETITPFIVGISTDPPKVDRGGTINVDWTNGASAFLRQSNQIYKQIYVSSGIERIYEIGPFWRKEVSESYRHLQESIGLDIEMQNPDNLSDLYQLACTIIKGTNEHLISKFNLTNHLQIPAVKDVPVLTYNEAVELLRKNGHPVTRGEDFGLVSEAKLGQLIKKSHCSDVLVIIDYPDTIKKFYTKQKEGGLTETFDIIVDGWELVSGAIRQTDGDLIRKSMMLSDINASDYEFYIGIVDGAPDHGGFCLGLDRLLAKIIDKEMVSDAVPFPRTYGRLIP